MNSLAERKDQRLVARTSTEVQEFIQKAADYSGATVSQFLIDSAMERARDIVERTEILRLSSSGADAVLAAMERPPQVNNRLRQAAQRYKDNMDAIPARTNTEEA